MWALSVAAFLVGYAFGSIPFGLIAGRLKGIDIRRYGSGNIGATNVLRVIGKPWGLSVFFADALKGFLAVRLVIAMAEHTPAAKNYVEFYAILAAAACVIGHSFPIWLRFKGGKGVATSAGSLLGVTPVAAIGIFLVWLIVFKITKYVSIASVLAASALPLIVWILIRLGVTQGFVVFYFSLAMTALVVWRHRSNISRLLKGTEPRFTRK